MANRGCCRLGRGVDSGSPTRGPALRWRRALGWFLAVVLAAAGCSRTEQTPAARHVILISIDTCRADHLSCYGFPDATTPNIDRVAREGVLFRNAVSTVPITLPAHCSMLTGMIPPSHGVHDNIDGRLARHHVTLAELLRKEGFATAAVISAFVLDRRFGLDQGFDEYLDDLGTGGPPLAVAERVGGDASRLAIDWLERNRDRDGFLFLHYYDPHALWAPPEPWASRYSGNPYAGEIAYVDSCIGSVLVALEELDLYDSSLIVIVGDHGEMLGEHGEDEHSYFIYQGALRVPLIIKLPGSRQPDTVDGWASLIDIVPTVCGALGIDAPPTVEGVDLLQPGALAGERPLYSESLTPTSYGGASLLGLIESGTKLIHTTRPELYDLAADPGERRDLALECPDTVAAMRAELERLLSEARYRGGSAGVQLDPDEVAGLDALGYVAVRAGEVSFDLDAQARHEDPKDLLEFHSETRRVSRLLAAGRLDEASRALGALLELRPGYTWAHRQLAAVAVTRGDLEGAVDHLRRALDLEPELVVVRAELARLLRARGDDGEAIEQLERCVQARPDDGSLRRSLGEALLARGRIEEAVEHLQDLVRLDPALPEKYLLLGSALASRGSEPEVVELYRRGLESRPDSVELLNNLAWRLAVSGEPRVRDGAEAVRLAERASRLSGDREPVVLDTLAAAYAAVGRFEEAAVVAQRAREAASSSGAEELAEQIDRRLELYRRGEPYVEP